MDNERVHRDADTYDVVVLAGGAGRRLGGVDKAMLPFAGRTLLDRLLAATSDARLRIVVGPPRAGLDRAEFDNTVVWTCEDPPGSGPLAGLAAGAAHGSAPVVLVLAVDLPFLDTATCHRLVAALTTTSRTENAAVLVDGYGQPQPLAAAYDRRALLERLVRIGDPADRPVRLVLEGLDVTTVAAPWAARDVDHPSDVETMMLIDWTRQLAEELEVDRELADLDLDAILDLARDAAHAVERPAAPVTTFLVGYAAARRGDGPELIADLVRRAGELARAQDS